MQRLQNEPGPRWHAVRKYGIAAAVLSAVVLSRKVLLPPMRSAALRRTRHPANASPSSPPAQPALDPNKLLAQRTQRLEQTMAALEGFCYTIAHDLRAPLRAMEGFSQALLEEYGPKLDATGLDYTQRISEAARRMDRMIQDLLDFEQLATVEPHSATIDLDSLVREVLLLLGQEIRVRAAQVRVQRPLKRVKANRTLFKRVLSELISNSLRFVPQGVVPSIRIWAEAKPGSVEVCLQDNGIGIAPEHQQRIFEPFVRLYGEDAYTGTGIGLAIVKRSVETMGGTVTLQSTAGCGTCFRIELPGV